MENTNSVSSSGYIPKWQVGVMESVERTYDRNILAFDSNTRRYVPYPLAPFLLTTFTGTLRNIQTNGTRYIRWGANTDGTADTVLIPDGGVYIGMTASFNDNVVINGGADPANSELALEVGLVYDTDPSNIEVPNGAGNFNVIDTVTRTGTEVENKCPQIVSRSPPVVSEENPMRISCRSITSGTLGFNNGDFVVTVYIVIDTSKYKGLPALGTNIPSLIIK